MSDILGIDIIGQGEQGIPGEQGKEGPEGKVGPQGPQGFDGIQGEPGKDGIDGRDFIILGMFPTIEDLQTAHPTGIDGDAWAVGNETANTIYLWDSDKLKWVDIGNIRGLDGKDGIDGQDGADGRGLPSGGDIGQVPIKNGIDDYDIVWGDIKSGVELVAGENINIDQTDPTKAIISSVDTGVLTVAGGEGIQVQTSDVKNVVVNNRGVIELQEGTNITINTANPRKPIINASGGVSLSENNYFTGYNDFQNANFRKDVGFHADIYVNQKMTARKDVVVEGKLKVEYTQIGQARGGVHFILGDRNLDHITGDGNILFGGSNIGGKLTTGKNNIMVGTSYTGTYQTTGSNNVFLGSRQITNVPTGDNMIVIGDLASGTTNDQITLGNNQISQLRCQATSISSLSDKRTKEYHFPADLKLCADTVMALSTQRYKYHKWTGTHLDGEVTGFMADDVEKVFPKCVHVADQYFPELDENGEEIKETIKEKRTRTITNEDGEAVQEEYEEETEQTKQFKLEDVKEIAINDQLVATLWGAVQYLIGEVELLKGKKAVTETAVASMIETVQATAQETVQNVTTKVEK